MTAGHYSVGNPMLSATWTIDRHHLDSLAITDKLHHRTIQLPDPFAILLADGSIANAETLEATGAPVRKSLSAQPSASRLAERVPGVEFDTQLVSKDAAFHATWAVILRDGSNYIRQSLAISAGDKDLPIQRVQLLDIALPGAQVVGSVKGSPIVSGDLFLGFEHPLSGSNVARERATAFIDRELSLKAGQSVTYSSVIGVAREGQMRRDFLAYVERERAHPYRTFLHYNSWYDLGYFSPYDQEGALDRVNAFGRELHEKRGVTLDSYLFDDGWDNHATLWSFNNGFPSGFSNVRKAAEKYGTDPGVWMSPWGGYAGPKKERVEFGRQQGFEVVSNGFALSGPKYYDRFRDVCLEMIRKYGVNQFKFDGTGNANSVFKGSAFDSDFSAALHLIGELRQEKPDLYINLTTGTYPSPFWLIFADSIWRGGEDDGFAGVGPYRERWITYRDADTYDRIVKAGPLYPLNSLMLHGMIYASLREQLNDDPSNDFRNEVRSYFGTGTQLQEMYLTPSLLSAQNWDDLAEAAKWSRGNASVLKDTHWVGGDPAWLEVYGWGAWTPQKATLVLRNPSDKPQSIRLDPQLVFELPKDAARRFTAHSPWKEDASKASLSLEAGTQQEFLLAPFEVLTFDVTPQ
ncbi:putative exported alpha-N-acetylgalactosaminidase [Granulicella sibirica]|uniref:Putative exported alpha-N-acetylgalactosaminidase n=1 Tax=Granulicella sibirica TaxID=2479048 RepID=A0A4Q0T6A3_9BACT|nr:putative exported alpha-N-acetylgalactosaminidase [Granulicella sibirica]